MKIYLIILILIGFGFVVARWGFIKNNSRYLNARSYLSIAAILLIGFTVHNAGLFVLAAGLILLVTVSDRMDVLCRLALLVALIPEITYRFSIGGLYLGGLTSSMALTLGAFVACSFRPGSFPRRGFGFEDLFVLALIAIVAIAGTREATSTGLLRECVTTTLELFLPYFVFSRYLCDSNEYAHVVSTLGAASLILAVIAVYEATFHWSLYDLVWRNQTSSFFMSRNINVRAGLLRTPTAFREATSFAVFQLIGTFAVIVSRPYFRTAFRWSCSIALCVIGLLAAQSRGADLGFVAGLIILMLVRRQFVRAAVVGAVGGSVILMSFIAASSFPRVAAFLGKDRSFGSDADYRETLLRRGIQEGMKHPLLGQDMTRVAAQLKDITQGEGIVDFVNTPLVIFLSSGFVGLTTVAVLTALIFKGILKRQGHRSVRHSIDLVQAFVGSALLAEWTALAFTSFWERNPYWMMIIVAGAKSLRFSQKHAGSPPQPGVLPERAVHPSERAADRAVMRASP